MKKSISFIITVLIALIFFMVFISSCSVDKKCQKAQRRYEMKAYKLGCVLPFLESEKDSVVITKHDTTFIFVTDSIYLRDTIRLDVFQTTPKSILTTQYSVSTAWVQNGLLQHFLEQKQVKIPITIKDAVQSHVAINTKVIRIPYPVEKIVKKDLSWIQKSLQISGIVLWLIIIAIVVLKVRRLINPMRTIDNS